MLFFTSCFCTSFVPLETLFEVVLNVHSKVFWARVLFILEGGEANLKLWRVVRTNAHQLQTSV